MLLSTCEMSCSIKGPKLIQSPRPVRLDIHTSTVVYLCLGSLWLL